MQIYLLLIYKITGSLNQNRLPSFLQLPNICGSGDVTCKLEMIPQGHCLEYNYDYDNGFSICRIRKGHTVLNFEPVGF